MMPHTEGVGNTRSINQRVDGPLHLKSTRLEARQEKRRGTKGKGRPSAYRRSMRLERFFVLGKPTNGTMSKSFVIQSTKVSGPKPPGSHHSASSVYHCSRLIVQMFELRHSRAQYIICKESADSQMQASLVDTNLLKHYDKANVYQT